MLSKIRTIPRDGRIGIEAIRHNYTEEKYRDDIWARRESLHGTTQPLRWAWSEIRRPRTKVTVLSGRKARCFPLS